MKWTKLQMRPHQGPFEKASVCHTCWTEMKRELCAQKPSMGMVSAIRACQLRVVGGGKESFFGYEKELGKSFKNGCRDNHQPRFWAESFKFRMLSQIAKRGATAPRIGFMTAKYCPCEPLIVHCCHPM